jgi:hypothetical protein
MAGFQTSTEVRDRRVDEAGKRCRFTVSDP